MKHENIYIKFYYEGCVYIPQSKELFLQSLLLPIF